MNCADVRSRLLELRRDRLSAGDAREVREHLDQCAACARADRAERTLDDVLDALPQYPARPALKRRLAALVDAAAPPRPARPAWIASRVTRWVAPALAAGLLVAVGSVVAGRGAERGRERTLLTAEAVNDHLRVLSSARGLDVESGGPHQVKPWFQGKLDFSPDVPEPPGLVLEGASLGYCRDRRAAIVVYKLRLHVVTLLQVRAEGLRWPAAAGEVREASDRHFHVFFWRKGDVGYALVSDADPGEIGGVARRLAGT